jgi:hypothetical protein
MMSFHDLCTYAVITLETAALDTSNEWPFWIQIPQLNGHQQYVRFENITWLRFSGTLIRTVTKHSL